MKFIYVECISLVVFMHIQIFTLSASEDIYVINLYI